MPELLPPMLRSPALLATLCLRLPVRLRGCWHAAPPGQQPEMRCARNQFGCGSPSFVAQPGFLPLLWPGRLLHGPWAASPQPYQQQPPLQRQGRQQHLLWGCRWRCRPEAGQHQLSLVLPWLVLPPLQLAKLPQAPPPNW